MRAQVLPRAAGGCPHIWHLHRLRHHHPREGVVRVVNRDTDDRILIKGMRGAEVDLVVAGVVDSMGNLFVPR